MQDGLPPHVRVIPQEIESAIDNRWYHAILSFGSTTMLNAVDIDVSKGKSTVTVLQPGGVSLKKPFDVTHSFSGLNGLKDYILSLAGDGDILYGKGVAGILDDTVAGAADRAETVRFSLLIKSQV